MGMLLIRSSEKVFQILHMHMSLEAAQERRKKMFYTSKISLKEINLKDIERQLIRADFCSSDPSKQETMK